MLRFVFALLLLASTLSCEREPDAADNTLRFINRGDIFTLDLNQMSYLQDFRVTYAIREGLYAPAGPEFTPIPAGALRCDLSEDKRVYTFHLRPDARWSNGDPVTAWDYLFSWRRMLEEPGEYTFFLYAVENAEAYQKAYQADKPISFEAVGAKAIDDHTLRVTLDRPIAYFLDLVAFPALYPRHSESMKPFLRATASGKTYYTNEYTRPPHVVTNGPFKLTKWEFKRVLRMERNPHYWDAANVKLDAIENIVNDNVLSQFLQYEAGAADWISEVPPDLAPELRKANRPDLQSTTAFGTAFLTLYCQPKFHPEVLGGSDNPLSDVRVRQALSMAIDRTIITQGITRMGEVAAEHYIPPGTLPGYTSLPGLRYNVEQARKLLAEAGYPDGRGFPKIPIRYNTENKTREKIVQSLKQQWKANLNIDLEIEGLEGKVFSQRNGERKYAISTVAWFGDYPDVSTFTDKYRSNSQLNDAAWHVPEYDALLNRAADETDPARRLELLQQAEQMINTQVPIIPLYHYVNSTLVGPRVKGISVNARSMTIWKNVSLEAKR